MHSSSDYSPIIMKLNNQHQNSISNTNGHQASSMSFSSQYSGNNSIHPHQPSLLLRHINTTNSTTSTSNKDNNTSLNQPSSSTTTTTTTIITRTNNQQQQQNGNSHPERTTQPRVSFILPNNTSTSTTNSISSVSKSSAISSANSPAATTLTTAAATSLPGSLTSSASQPQYLKTKRSGSITTLLPLKVRAKRGVYLCFNS